MMLIKTNAKKRPGQAGFSLIELVLGLSIISIIMPSTMVVFQQVMQTKFMVEARISASNLALEIMEHTLQKRFSNIVSVDRMSVAFDNQDGDCTDDDNANDDEYDGDDSPFCDHNFANFQFAITVTSADPDDLDADCSAGGANCNPDYKKVMVEVFNDRMQSSVRITSLATRKS